MQPAANKKIRQGKKNKMTVTNKPKIDTQKERKGSRHVKTLKILRNTAKKLRAAPRSGAMYGAALEMSMLLDE